MHSVDAILPQLANLNNIDAVRWAVVALIQEQLRHRRDNLDDWEAAHFTNAIGMLAMNINAVRQPTAAWLRLCLVDLQHALTPKTERQTTIADHQNDDESSPYLQVAEALDAVIRQLDRRRSQISTPAKVFRRYLDRISDLGNSDFRIRTLNG